MAGKTYRTVIIKDDFGEYHAAVLRDPLTMRDPKQYGVPQVVWAAAIALASSLGVEIADAGASTERDPGATRLHPHGRGVVWFGQSWRGRVVPEQRLRTRPEDHPFEVEEREFRKKYPRGGVHGVGDCGCQGSAPQLRGVSMTYGVLPPLADYYAAFDAAAPTGWYRMQLNTRDGFLVAQFMQSAEMAGHFQNVTTARHRGDTYFVSRAGLYNLLAAMIRSNREDAADFASNILQTLGFEWV